ncbi:MAG: NYN domain-containing protein [Bacteroidota bacterium]
MVSEEKIERVIVYVDGFNLYFGMLQAGLTTCKWLNLRRLAETLLKPNQRIESIKYFTSMVNKNPGKQKRQVTYIEALETVGIEVIYGRYQSYNVECFRCGDIRSEQNEKMTDVNIATHIIIDAYQDKI